MSTQSPPSSSRPSDTGMIHEVPGQPEPTLVIPAKYTTMEGAYSGFQPNPSTYLRVFVHGLVGQGKTTLLRSVPQALVLDFEHKASCVVSPHKTNLAMAIQSLEAFEKLVDELLKDAQRKDTKFFNYICFDTADGFLSLVRRGLSVRYGKLDKYNKSKDPYFDLVNWGAEGAGRAIIYDWIQDKMDSLYDAGYGWFCTTHLQYRRRGEDEKDSNSLKYEATISPGLRKYLYKNSDFIMEVEERPLDVSVEEVKKIPDLKNPGKTITKTMTKTRREHKHLLLFSSVQCKAVSRVQIPMMEDYVALPLSDGWSLFIDLLEKSIAAIEEKTQQ